MAWNSAYATAAEYRSRTGKTTTGDDADILEQLTAASRAIERCTFDVFNKTLAGVVQLMDGRGGDWLPVNPSVALLESLKVDTNGDGTYDATVVAGDLIANPQSVDANDERPVRAYRLHPKQSTITAFPHRVVAVEITATFGWKAVPDAIREACVDLTRSIRDLQLAGHTMSLQNLDQAVALSPEVARVVQRLEGTYKRHDLAIPMPV